MSDPPQAALRFEHFSLALRHADRREILLKDCNLSVPAGGFYLLAGRSGSGKSTLLRLVTGLWDPREPRPEINGKLFVLGVPSIGDPPRSLRGRVSAVLQDE